MRLLVSTDVNHEPVQHGVAQNCILLRMRTIADAAMFKLFDRQLIPLGAHLAHSHVMSSPSTQPIARPRRPAPRTNGASDSKPSDAQSPPPPYQIAPEVLDGIIPLHKRNLSVCSVSSNVDPSVALTAQMLGLDLDTSRGQEQDRELDENYIRDKSKEELEKLLLKAEAVIRARERGEGCATNTP